MGTVSLIFGLLCACGKTPTPSAPPSAPPQAAAPRAAAPAAVPAVAAADPPSAATPAAATTAAGPAAIPALQRFAVDALLSRWLKAQNDGAFDDYSLLYAARFEGIKRSGARVRSFDRAGWLADRRRMFGKSMQVRADEPRVAIAGATAVVAFDQTWASGSYRDVGRKHLVLVQEGTELRIAREAMLTSQLQDAAATASIAPALFAPVQSHLDQHWLLLAPAPDTTVETVGAPRLVVAGPMTLAAKALRSLPAAAEGWDGREVDLFGEQGVRCRGRVAVVEVLARIQPHFGTVQRWQGIDAPPPAAAEVEREAWDLAADDRWLAARVVPVAGADCGGAIWGRAQDQPPSALASDAPPDPALLAMLRARLQKLPAWRSVQQTYEEQVEQPRPASWADYRPDPMVARSFALPDGSRLAWVALAAGEGCADFRGDVWALFRVAGAGADARAQLLSDDRDPGPPRPPRAAADLDGDGVWELIAVDTLLRAAGPTWRQALSWIIPSLDCGC